MKKPCYMTDLAVDTLSDALNHGRELSGMFGRDPGGIHLKYDKVEFRLIPTGGAEIMLWHGGEVVWRKEMKQVMQAYGDSVELTDASGQVRVTVHR